MSTLCSISSGYTTSSSLGYASRSADCSKICFLIGLLHFTGRWWKDLQYYCMDTVSVTSLCLNYSFCLVACSKCCPRRSAVNILRGRARTSRQSASLGTSRLQRPINVSVVATPVGGQVHSVWRQLHSIYIWDAAGHCGLDKGNCEPCRCHNKA